MNNLTGAGFTPDMAQAYYAIDSIKKGRQSGRRGSSHRSTGSGPGAPHGDCGRQQTICSLAYMGIPLSPAPSTGGSCSQRQCREAQKRSYSLRALASGEPAGIGALGVTLMNLRATGNLVKVYNLLLDHADAAILKSKVAAIREQAVKKAIDAPTELAQLQGLGLTPAWAQSIVAKDAAQASKVALPV